MRSKLEVKKVKRKRDVEKKDGGDKKKGGRRVTGEIKRK